MAERTGGILASFEFLDSTVDAIHELRKAGFKNLRAYMPFPEHHVEEALGYGESPVRVWTLVGALTGTATGFALTIFTSMDWPLVTGGKPIIAIPTSVVIAFECTILFGALSTLIGLFINTRLPHIKPTIIYDPEFVAGRFGLYVPADGGQLDEARRILQRHEPKLLTEDREGAHVG
jgi:molybdopterin-containing oxidoreductase family membrane subunit